MCFFLIRLCHNSDKLPLFIHSSLMGFSSQHFVQIQGITASYFFASNFGSSFLVCKSCFQSLAVLNGSQNNTGNLSCLVSISTAVMQKKFGVVNKKCYKATQIIWLYEPVNFSVDTTSWQFISSLLFQLCNRTVWLQILILVFFLSSQERILLGACLGKNNSQLIGKTVSIVKESRCF